MAAVAPPQSRRRVQCAAEGAAEVTPGAAAAKPAKKGFGKAQVATVAAAALCPCGARALTFILFELYVFLNYIIIFWP